jgi:hypothetical protein
MPTVRLGREVGDAAVHSEQAVPGETTHAPEPSRQISACVVENFWKTNPSGPYQGSCKYASSMETRNDRDPASYS